MKTLFKNYLKIFLFLIGVSVLLWNCEQEEVYESPQQEVSKSSFRTKVISLTEIPEIERYLLDKTNVNIFTKSTKVGNAIFDEDNILEVIDTLNYTNYSLRFVFPDTPLGTFYNLIVGKTKAGEKEVPFVLKYTCDASNLNEYMESDYNFDFFKGTMELHKYTDFFKKGSFTKSNPDCPENLDEFGDPIPCEKEEVDGSSSGGDGGSNTEGTGNTNTGSTNDDDSSSSYSNCRFLGIRKVRYRCNSFYGDNVWCVKSVGVWDCAEKSYRTKSSDLCPDCIIPSGGVGVNPYIKIVQKVNYYLDYSLSNLELIYLNEPKNLNFTTNVRDFLLNNVSQEAKDFARNMIGLEMILSGNSKIVKTNKHPLELDSCCPGPCCPEQAIYGQDLIIQEYGIQPIQSSIDATFNLIVSSIELVNSDKWVGSRIRSLMNKISVNVPTDIKDEYLAAVYQIRKRDGIVIVEYRPGLLKSMLNVGLNTLDILTMISPSKGGGAFLAAKAGGRITITNITNHIRKITVSNTKINNIINSLKNKAKFVLDGTGEFKKVGGHHPLAKIAFKSDKFYDLQKAFSVSSSTLDNAWKTVHTGIPQNLHPKITGQQNSLYSAFKKTGEVLTLDKMAKIEIQAMVNVGIPENIAKGWVIKALENLKAQGVKMITNIPWNGLN